MKKYLSLLIISILLTGSIGFSINQTKVTGKIVTAREQFISEGTASINFLEAGAVTVDSLVAGNIATTGDLKVSGDAVIDGSLSATTGTFTGGISGTTGTFSDDVGITGKISLNDGGSSVFVGEGAGLNDDGTDNRNVGVGVQSLYYNTTGGYNTATGYKSLYYNTTGIRNTANGYYSLYANTTGSNNTATGYYSLRANTTGYNNTAIRKLLCKIGLHKWCSWDSHCERCGKYSKRQYDKVKEKTND